MPDNNFTSKFIQLKELIEEFDFYCPSDQDACIHWTGLKLSRLSAIHPKLIVEMIKRAIEIKEQSGESDQLRKRWADFREAESFLGSFSEWFREKIYPKWTPKDIDERQKWTSECLKVAQKYIKDYDEGMMVSWEDLTDQVPEELRKRYKEAMALYEQIRSSTFEISFDSYAE